MLDPKWVRETPDVLRQCYRDRRFPLEPLETYIQLDNQWRDSVQATDEKKALRNAQTPKGKPTPDQLQELKALSDEVTRLDQVRTALEEQVREAALQLPNRLAPDVPVGVSAQDNPVVRTIGEVPVLAFPVHSHDVLAEKLGLIDFARAVKITGARFALYQGLGARLERAVIAFMLRRHTQAGYLELLPSAIVNSRALLGTGQLPKFGDDLFRLADTDYWLSPTAEVQLTNYYQNEVLEDAQLPVRLTAFTPCFRKEAGSYGKDLKGLIRLHQFHKIELVQLVRPEASMAALEALCQDAEDILVQLKLPYRVVKLCSGDIGFGSAKTYDLEIWFPSQNQYREVSSCSNFLDFQARRAMIRYRNADKRVEYVHTLNGSGLAVGRTVAAILENYQQADGSIRVPEVLRPFMGVDIIG
ncbi:MAG: serine--tRNA ligase [Candidatus Margulisiibacteriota bacterium]